MKSKYPDTDSSAQPISMQDKNRKVVALASSDKRLDEWSVKLKKVADDKDQLAFREIFEHFAPLLKGFCISHVVASQSEQALDEIIQEVMLKVWRKAGNYDPYKAAANTWIFTILRNTRIDYLRKNARHMVSDNELEADEIWDEELDHQPLKHLQQSRTKSTIYELLANIPSEQSTCLKKVYLEGKTHTEIAEELGLPLGTIKSRVRLGIKRIQTNQNQS